MLEHAANAAGNNLNRKGRFLLVVDSDTDHRYFLSMLLQRFEYKTFTAATAREALAMTAVTVPSLIIISAGLMDMSGLDLMQHLRQESSTAAVPLIAMRRQDDVIGEGQCFKQGVIACLCKPVSAEQLYRSVQEILEATPRAHIRIRTLLPVQTGVASYDYFDDAFTTDLSEGGMFVRTGKPADVNMRLSCRLQLYGQVIQMDTIVLYRNRLGGKLYREPGMGLQFSRIEAKDRELIRRFVRNEVTRGIPFTHA
jgi:two-component system cell cycle response regulator DivK